MRSEVHNDRGWSLTQQWWLVSILTTLSTLAYIDKNIAALMIGPIKGELQLTAPEVTIAIGGAFALANVLIIVPAGILADRADRRLTIWLAVLIWSVMTIACGLADGFAGLLMTRFGIGLAEGLLPPACYSLIRERIAVSRRARALGIFSMASLAGAGIAFLGGALLLGVLTHVSFLEEIPIFGSLSPWRATLVAIGIVGIPVSFLALTIRETVRKKVVDQAETPSLAATFREMGKHRTVFVLIGIYSVSNAMLGNSNALWTAPMAVARFDYLLSEIGAGIGLQLLILGPIGLFAAGYFIDRWDAATGRGTYKVALLVSVVLLLADVMTPLAQTRTQFWLWQSLMMLVSATYFVVTANLVSKLLPSDMTGRAIAFLLLLQGLIGIGLAPTLTAILIETVFSTFSQPIAMAMVSVNSVFGVTALIAAFLLYRQSGTWSTGTARKPT